MSIIIRAYEPADEASWLRCRVLSFLHTCYFDDVWQARPPEPAVQLVASNGGEVVGILDVEIDGSLATIDTVAVLPEHQGRGIAGALLDRALDQLPPAVEELDAWTREDAPALAWYRGRGFDESDHYLHVYKRWDDPVDGWTSPAPLTPPVIAFCHVGIEDEDRMRAEFARVYVCRRFSRATASP